MLLLLVNIIVLGAIVWCIGLIPVVPTLFVQIITVVCAIVAVLWCFQFFGITIVSVPYLLKSLG